MDSVTRPELKISAIVCTYNRAGLLANVLQDLSKQELKKSEYEVLIVDNNSTDSTRRVAEEFCKSQPNARYVFEARQGNAYARNAGWTKASGHYVGYIDDDCRVPQAWLGTAADIIRAHSPGFLGGPLYPWYIGSKPVWFKDDYGTYRLPLETAQILTKGYLFGANMFVRRALLEQVGDFDTRFGRAGANRGYGGEIGPQIRVRQSRPAELFYYSPALAVHHLVQPGAMTLRYRVRERLSMGYSVYGLFHGNSEGKFGPGQAALEALWSGGKAALDSMRGIVFRDRVRYPYFQNYFYEHTGEYFTALGRVYAKYQWTKSTPRLG